MLDPKRELLEAAAHSRCDAVPSVQDMLANEVPSMDETITWLTRDQAIDFFDRQVRDLLNMSGVEFRRRLAAGDFAQRIDEAGNSDLMYLALLAAGAK